MLKVEKPSEPSKLDKFVVKYWNVIKYNTDPDEIVDLDWIVNDNVNSEDDVKL